MTARSGFTPIVTVVGFHHARGPEVEMWFGVEEGSDPAEENDWPLLPFMALSDGAHVSTEDFSYFTLRRAATSSLPATSLFGISCTRQMDASQLVNRPADVTRSTVQKAVVVIAESPQYFGQLREKLSMVTGAWFVQRDFSDVDILKKFQESLPKTLHDNEDDRDQYLGESPNSVSCFAHEGLLKGVLSGLSLRELIHEFKYQTLVLFKCCLLQPKMLFFGSRCERLSMMQFSLISLIPGLIRSLQDCADPELDSYEKNLVMPASLKTSERNSLLTYMGLPLQIFGKGSLFGPYTPLQQLDILADYGTKSFIVGSTNPLLLQQKDRYSDILVNLDEGIVGISSSSLRASLSLSVADRRWIDFLTQSVQETWDPDNPGRPITMGYVGSEEFIRLQFEEYLLALISSVKYHIHVEKSKDNPHALLSDIEGDPSHDFGSDWVDAWMETENFRIFQKFTDSHLYDIVEPHHPCAGGLTMEDIQRRLTQQVSELHLDERFSTGKEALNKHLATGQKKVSSAFNNLWADIETMREAQRKRQEEARANAAAASEGSQIVASGENASTGGQPHISISAASSRAGAYFSSWGTWAAEKRKAAWGKSASTDQSNRSKSPPKASATPLRQFRLGATPAPTPSGLRPLSAGRGELVERSEKKENRRSGGHENGVRRKSESRSRSRPQSRDVESSGMVGLVSPETTLGSEGETTEVKAPRGAVSE
ncbi:MAG: late secretory pathway protein avl9 [Candelina mexicana]|nr:MAG: late secretory pathway protein avl9 [Candelina mexicana]